MVTKECKRCGKSVTKPKRYSYKQWDRFSYCSVECLSIANRDKSNKVRGKQHYAWKGDKVSYRSLHKWIERAFGKPSTCEFCNRTNLKSRSINWANKSGKYLRRRSDWLRLCRSCHMKYDYGKRKTQREPKRK